MAFGLDALGVRQDLGAAVRRGPQADHLGAEFDEPVVSIMRDVAQSDMNGHVGAFNGEETMNRRAQAGPWALGLILASLAPNFDDSTAGTTPVALLRKLS